MDETIPPGHDPDGTSAINASDPHSPQLREASQSPGPVAVLEERSILRLMPHPLQEFFFPAEEGTDIAELADDILANGLKEAIEIDPEGTILVGHRRRHALLRLHAKGHQQFGTTKVLVRHDLAAQGPEALLNRFLRDNLLRRQLTTMRMAMVSKAIYEAKPSNKRNDAVVKQRIANQFTVSVKTLDRWWALVDLPPELFNLVALKKVSQQVGLLLVKHATPAEIEELRKLAEEAPDSEVVHRLKKLAYSRMTPERRKINPAKVLRGFVRAGQEIGAFHAEIADHLAASDHRIQLKNLRFEVRRIEIAMRKLLAVLESHPELEGVADERSLEWNNLTWDELVRQAQSQRDDEQTPSPEASSNADETLAPVVAPSRAKLTLPPLAPKKQPPPLKLNLRPPQADLPPLKLRKPPAA